MYRYWKDAVVSFNKHEQSSCHRESVEMVISLPSSKHIGSHLSQQYVIQLESSSKVLWRILASIRYLARQGLALRGDGDESDGNFLQLLKLPGDEIMLDWLNYQVMK